MEFLNSPVLTWVVLPALIFLARVCDVSLGTIRVIFVARGMRHLAPLVGFFEILIWLMAIGQIFSNLNNPACYLAYAAGFAAGNFVGIAIVDRLHLGKVILRIITDRPAYDIIARLTAENIGLTTVDASGAEGPVKLVFSVIERADLPRVINMVREFHPHAFFTVEDVRFASEGIFPVRRSKIRVFEDFRLLRKSK